MRAAICYNQIVRVLGLTGDIACGKSTVAAMLASRGAAILDADALVHELYADPAFASRVAKLFTSSILDEAGRVDRKKLGVLVFQDDAALRKLESLVHPAVANLRDDKLQALHAQKPSPPVVVIEAVKLIESGQAKGCDAVWCVVSTRTLQEERLIQTRGLSREQAWARLDAQPSREDKRKLMESSAPGVPLMWIENNASLQELAHIVEQQWQAFHCPVG